MPLPFIIGGIAAVAGAVGAGSGIHGAMKMKDANDTMKLAQSKQENAVDLFKRRNNETTTSMDTLGKKELEILSSFNEFSDLIEKIQGRPEFKEYKRNGIDLPEYEAEELRKISAGAGVLLGGIGGAAAGTAGGFAAAGMTTSAVMALGTASTGTAISTLSGVAATNATLAALGGGAIASGGGGMALGSAVLGGATLGVGLLIGGVIFNVTGSKLSDKADEAYRQAQRTENEVNKIVGYLNELSLAAVTFKNRLIQVDDVYKKNFNILKYTVKIKNNFGGYVQWDDFTQEEKRVTENTIMLVGLLHKMCKVNLVVKQEKENELNKVNKTAIDDAIKNADAVLSKINAA